MLVNEPQQAALTVKASNRSNNRFVRIPRTLATPALRHILSCDKPSTVSDSLSSELPQKSDLGQGSAASIFEKSDSAAFLQSVDGEISFFRSIMRARPIGIHRHFHVLAIQNAMFKDTGRLVQIDDIWAKLRSCYNMDALEAIDLEAEGYESPKSNKSTPISIRSPSPSQNLSAHPYFREEFSLPLDDSFDAMIQQRRMRATASLPSSSPAPSPVSKSHAGKKRGRTKLSMAGLVGGDSDSSALTQESGDEGIVGSQRAGSVVTGTDPGTDQAEEEDIEMREPSIAPSMSPRPARGRGKGTKKGGGRGRGGGAGAAGVGRPTKKRKRA
ncbi:putative chromatin modification-related protein EAF7 [Lyophyllum shimeji]|uniref:Chromatin modification-related protein EAF7 n=1 Tax=Lyophyllum shimeji TaxID=47721 RepID=A0A9P3PL69_LYOSH|nr:putative chromatin modification-related protein EAF7 [Lyophyllum shimeji]